MILRDEDVKKFQELYRTEFEQEISLKEAYEQGLKTLTTYGNCL